MAMRVLQLQVVERLTAASTAPNPMVNGPGPFFGLKDLPAQHASSLLPLPEIFDPASTCQGVSQLPDRPFLQVEFPLRIVRVGCTPNLLPSQDLDPRCAHEPDRSRRARAITDRARECPVPVALALEVSLLDPLPTLLRMASATPPDQVPEDPVVHRTEDAFTHGIAMVHGPALDSSIQAPDQVARRHAARVVDRFLDLGQK